jgi:hypothetical protein
MYTGPARFESNLRVESDSPLTYREQPPLGTETDEFVALALLEFFADLLL